MSRAFNPDMLILARSARDLSQTELAERVPAMSQSRLSRVEAGLSPPTPEEIGALADALQFKPAFFHKPHSRRAMPAAYHRRRQKLSKGNWDTIYARAEVVRIAIADMLNSVELKRKRPPLPLLDLDDYGGDVEAVAEAIRHLWSIPRGPVDDVTRIVESAGIIVVHMDFGTNLIDGFSQFATPDFPAIIFVNRKMPLDRIRFTVSHEICHLALHLLPHPKMEEEANLFASAFLMPRDDIRQDLYGMSVERLKQLKLTWKTAMSALIRRARDIGRVSEASYKYYLIEFSRRGWRTKEPIEIQEDIEKPRIVRQLFEAHTSKLDYSLKELSSLFGWEEKEVAEMFGSERPRLRLIMN
jgi:Zn-dependent peptidase ImmA (M78 family)/transcriptional regulator with XRE-family HTH domain